MPDTDFLVTLLHTLCCRTMQVNPTNSGPRYHLFGAVFDTMLVISTCCLMCVNNCRSLSGASYSPRILLSTNSYCSSVDISFFISWTIVCCTVSLISLPSQCTTSGGLSLICNLIHTMPSMLDLRAERLHQLVFGESATVLKSSLLAFNAIVAASIVNFMSLGLIWSKAEKTSGLPRVFKWFGSFGYRHCSIRYMTWNSPTAVCSM